MPLAVRDKAVRTGALGIIDRAACFEVIERMRQRETAIANLQSLANRLLIIRAVSYLREIQLEDRVKLDWFRLMVVELQFCMHRGYPYASLTYYTTPAAMLPQAFHTMIQVPSWNIDTGASCHLADNIANANVFRAMWLFKHKSHADGSLSRYKARLVANRRNQQQGIDCEETFSPVVKPTTIRTVLSLVVSRDWPIHQLDVKNAFLHSHLSETVYMHQLPGFVDSHHPDYVCHL
nr:ribonuclease H-like domain-containing protein [Tanacetum cinerariifolium]